MKTMNMLKLAGLLVLIISFAAGCAAGPAEEPANGDAEAAQEAIESAKAALKRAEDEGYAWRDTGDIIKQAEAAYDEGNYQEATDLANEARRQSELAIQQKYDELERIGAAEGAPAADTNGRVSSYTVERGDSLWAISGKSEVYNDPYQWPLIYRTNQDQIEDADLIYPGQNLSIDQNVTEADVATAVRHARNRGAWALGEVEDSDRAYLGR